MTRTTGGRPGRAEQVLAVLREADGSLGVADVAGRIGVHVNTARFHLDALVELAEGHARLICRIHLGLMQGALYDLRAPVTAAVLVPFAEPGACLVRLERASAA